MRDGRYLLPTALIDSDARSIRDMATALSSRAAGAIGTARALFYFVRDAIRYNPYASLHPLTASGTLGRGYGFCVQKAVLLAALARAAGIPARLGFVDIRNHRLDPIWKRIFRGDVVVFHGFTELFLNGIWVKATPAFDLRTCQENDFLPVEFDGIRHAMLSPRDQKGRPHIEYLEDRGRYEDVPLEAMLRAVSAAYGPEFVKCWEEGVWDRYAGIDFMEGCDGTDQAAPKQ